MKILEMEQGSHEWHQARLGMLTASKMHILFTPTGKQTANATRRRYALKLAIERITKMPTSWGTSFAAQRGTELEPLARMRYTLDTGRAVKEVGFVVADSGLTGASPDGIIGDDGAIEIKCFEMHHYAQMMLADDLDHAIKMQCQHVLYVTERDWIDFVLFTDVMPFDQRCYIKRIERDDDICNSIEIAVSDFAKEIDEYESALIERAKLTPDMLMFDAPILTDVDSWTVGE